MSSLELLDTTPTELASASFVLGQWRHRRAIEVWVPAGDVLVGVSFDRDRYEVSMIDRLDGEIRYVARPNGGAAVPFVRASGDNGIAVFENAAHDDPQRIRYSFDGERLETAIGSLDRESFVVRWKPQPLGSAPALVAADRAFASDVAARGVDGWVAAFDPAGHQWDDEGGVAVAPGEAMRAHMAGTLAGDLRWEPVHSGLSPDGGLGFTVGSWTWSPPGGAVEARGAYVTVWRKQPDGSWKVWYDGGDPIDADPPAPASDPAPSAPAPADPAPADVAPAEPGGPAD